jgi:hypothetical protein
MSAGRLIVLVPADADYGSMTRRIWELAIATSMSVQLLGLCKDAAQEPGLRRLLVIMSALIEDGKVSAKATIENGANWVEAVKKNYQSGDMIVCFAEQYDVLLHKPLHQILEANLEVPVYIISGLYPQGPSRFNVFSLISLWAGAISIIAGAFLLQTRILSLPGDWAQTTLLILSVLVEFWLIWIWNKLFS